MPKIIWDESFSVNNAEIDNQHKKWIDIINELHDALIEGRELIKITGKSLDAMIEYGEFHFSSEEKYMKKINFPNLTKHVYLHSDFLTKLKQIKKKMQNGAIVMNRELMDELMNWLLDHILEEDQKYAGIKIE